jgi:chromatin remodeling complex protein RSC6
MPPKSANTKNAATKDKKAPAPKKEAVQTSSAASAATTPVKQQAVVEKPVEQQVVTKEVESDTIISNLLEKVCALSTHVKCVQSCLKVLLKEFEKQKKVIDKVQKKKEKAKKSPSGFAKPCKISDELCTFIGVTSGTEMSRTDITRHINSYVKEHDLNNPENRREFFPDKKLKAILNVQDGEKVTYFVLQRLIAHHFPPSAAKLAAAAKAAG